MLASLHELCVIAMSDKPDDFPYEPLAPLSEPPAPAEPRKYEESGCYPENGKPYRVWALLGGLMLVIVVLAGVAVLLNVLLLPEA
jgi:hypothetical protein